MIQKTYKQTMVQNFNHLSKHASVERPRANNRTTINAMICAITGCAWMDMPELWVSQLYAKIPGCTKKRNLGNFSKILDWEGFTQSIRNHIFCA